MSTLPLLYQGSVKDLRGPFKAGSFDAVLFDYTDAYSVFDWGKMPDALPEKGASLAVIAADWFEKLESPETWKEFSKSPDALSLRRANRFGSAFIEIGELLQKEGLRTHYLGVPTGQGLADLGKISGQTRPFSKFAVQAVSVVKPRVSEVLGCSVFDYSRTLQAPVPRLVPLEVVFRFSCPPGSSYLERAKVEAGVKWDFPVLELFTKLESTDRLLTLPEGLAISGLSPETLQEMLFKTAWVAAWVKWRVRSACSSAGLELADGKFEWALGTNRELVLVDAIGPDERILKGGTQLSKEFLRSFYRATPWYENVVQAKKEASSRGSAEWKKWVAEGPPSLPPAMKELASQLYQALANELTGRRWFDTAWELERVVAGIPSR